MKTGEINIHDSNRPRKAVAGFDLGMDAGSVSVNLVVMTPAGEVLRVEYRRHLGQPQSIALDLLILPGAGILLAKLSPGRVPGLGGQALAEAFGGTLVNEVIAQARGTYHFRPEARTIIDMGARTPTAK
jgi:activator of 2-hydroxyglutaryl-CoA dehydratase